MCATPQRTAPGLTSTPQLSTNFLSDVPAGVLALTRLGELDLSDNSIVNLSVGFWTRLSTLVLSSNPLLKRLPRDIVRLRGLNSLVANECSIEWLPYELGKLPHLSSLQLQNNRLAWLPASLHPMCEEHELLLDGNALLPAQMPGAVCWASWTRFLPELLAATSSVLMIRERALEIAVGLQDLELPALVTLEILDAAVPNAVAMHKKWDIVVAVKHFHSA